MLKYIKQYASSIEGVSIYPIVSLLIFVLFFLGVLYYVKKIDKQQVNEISNLPLEDIEESSNLFNSIHQA